MIGYRLQCGKQLTDPGGSVNRRILIDLDAIAANYRAMQIRVSPSRCAAVVKANAYGLGVGPVARVLSAAGCDAFFVATADEALELREILVEPDIYILEGVDDSALDKVRLARLIPVLNSFEQAELWAGTAQEGTSVAAILHLDTGMSRLGMDFHDIDRLVSSKDVLDGLAIDYVMTHLACADEPLHEANAEQLQRFTELRQLLPSHRTSIANSAGTFLGTKYCGDLARAGIALFGGNPRASGVNPMREVIRLCGRVVQMREAERALSVGYGATVRVAPSARLATVALGYADGYPRCLGNKAVAQLGQHRAPVIGRVSMDSLVLDLSMLPDNAVRVGDWATLIGGGIELDQLASLADTISYELLTGIGPRVRRVYFSRSASAADIETDFADPFNTTDNPVARYYGAHTVGCT